MMPAAQFPEFKDRAVLVTGGGSGIGAAIVEGFARQGAKVSFIDIAEAAGHKLAERLSQETTHPLSFTMPICAISRRSGARSIASLRAQDRSACWSTMPPGTTAMNLTR